MFPHPVVLLNSNKVLLHVLLGNEVFRLHLYMIKPYNRRNTGTDSQRAVFNYRLSRARKESENCLCFLNQVFCVFYIPIAVEPETTESLVIVACYLHN